MLSTGTSKLEIVTAESLGGRCTLISAGKDNWIKVSTIRPDNRVHGRYVRVSLVLLLSNIYLTDIYFEGGKDRCKSKDWQPLLICQEIRRCCMNALPASFSTCRPPPPLKKKPGETCPSWVQLIINNELPIKYVHIPFL